MRADPPGAPLWAKLKGVRAGRRLWTRIANQRAVAAVRTRLKRIVVPVTSRVQRLTGAARTRVQRLAARAWARSRPLVIRIGERLTRTGGHLWTRLHGDRFHAWLNGDRVAWLSGIVLIVAGLALPWLGIPLENERHAWSLGVLFPGFFQTQWLSYGLVIAVALAAGLGRHLRSRRDPSAPLALAGLAIVAATLCFYASSAICDQTLLAHLNLQTGEQKAITGILGYTVPRTVPSSFLFIPLPGSWRTIAFQLRPGWFAVLTGGILMVWGSRRGLADTARAWRRRTWVVTGVAIIIACTVLFGRGIAANIVANDAITQVQAGDYRHAIDEFTVARSLDPDMVVRLGVEEAWGRALGVTGTRSAPMALLADAADQEALGDTQRQRDDLREAWLGAPDDPVIQYAYVGALRRAALREANLQPLKDLIDAPIADHPAEHYVLGRLLYSHGEYAAAEAQFTDVLDETPEPNARSTALTYRGLAELRSGDRVAARKDIVLAVTTDVEYNNSLARSLAAGLYQAIPA